MAHCSLAAPPIEADRVFDRNAERGRHVSPRALCRTYGGPSHALVLPAGGACLLPPDTYGENGSPLRRRLMRRADACLRFRRRPQWRRQREFQRLWVGWLRCDLGHAWNSLRSIVNHELKRP